jgi:hypothetical protein
LGGNDDQVPYIDEIKKRGFIIYLTDQNENAPGKKYANEFFKIGYDNFEEIIKLLKKINFKNTDKIFTASSQFAHLAMSRVAKIYNIKYPNIETIEMCLDKAKFYEAFVNCNLNVPKYFKVKNFLSLKNTLNELDAKNYYLKSDMSKNPNYVYKINKKNFLEKKIFWGKDRYLDQYYILQEEFLGENLRVNIFKNDYNVFEFFSSKLVTEQKKKQLEKLNIIEKLKKFLKVHCLSDWLIKFDIIIANNNWCVLDIGLDPPMRMKKLYDSNGLNFASFYVDQYIENKVNYI